MIIKTAAKLALLAAIATLTGAVNIGSASAVAPCLQAAPIGNLSGIDAPTGDVIELWFEHDLHIELRNDTPDTDDSGLTINHVILTTMQAAEIWNNEARGTPVVYGGITGADNRIEFCDNVPRNRAGATVVYVNFEEGTPIESAYVEDICGTGAITKAITLFPKSNGSTHEKANWDIGSQGAWFSNTMVHEVGHLFSLEHAHLTSPQECYSVMSYNGGTGECPNTPDGGHGGRHLLNWDKQCAHAYVPDRAVDYVWAGWDYSGAGPLLDDHPVATKRGFIGGGHTKNSAGAWYYSLYFYDGIASAANFPCSVYVCGYADGTFGFGNVAQFTSNMSDVFDLEQAPSVFAVEEYPSNGNGLRINFVDDENDSNTSIQYNPPYVQYIRTTSALEYNGSDYSYQVCADLNCSSTTSLRSHLPLVGTWDPISQTTVFARVVTNSRGDFKTTELDGGGEIWLHGLWGSYNDRLTRGTKLDQPLPTSYDAWGYEGRTDFTPAIACGDVALPGSGGYNCILAWTNKGMALSTSQPATILYKFFNVDIDGEIRFRSGTVKIRGGSDAASAPALGFFGGKMWLAWKTVGSLSRPRVRIQNSSEAYVWTTVYESGGNGVVVDPPTFLYGTQRESATLWTVVP